MKPLTLYAEQGSDYGREIVLYDSTDAPINLTGKVVSSVINKSPLTAHIGHFTVQTVDVTDGRIRISLPNATTATLLGKYYYTIYVTINNVVTIGRIGTINVNRNIL